MAEHVGQCADDRPIFARFARWEGRAIGQLHPSFGVHVNSGFFRISRARQDHVGTVRPCVTMRADINDKTARTDVDLVRAQKEQHVGTIAFRHLQGRVSALARHEADIERADAGGRLVQHGEAIPVVLDHAQFDRNAGGERRHTRAIVARERAGRRGSSAAARLFSGCRHSHSCRRQSRSAIPGRRRGSDRDRSGRRAPRSSLSGNARRASACGCAH